MTKFRHVYTAQFVNVAFLTANGNYDIWELVAGIHPIEILEVRIGQMLHDASDNKVPMQITIGKATASGSGGTAATIRNVDTRSTATSCTGEYMNDVEASGLTRYVTDAWELPGPFLYQPLPEARLQFAAGEMCVVHMTNPGYDITSPGMCSTITFAEFK